MEERALEEGIKKLNPSSLRKPDSLCSSPPSLLEVIIKRTELDFACPDLRV